MAETVLGYQVCVFLFLLAETAKSCTNQPTIRGRSPFVSSRFANFPQKTSGQKLKRPGQKSSTRNFLAVFVSFLSDQFVFFECFFLCSPQQQHAREKEKENEKVYLQKWVCFGHIQKQTCKVTSTHHRLVHQALERDGQSFMAWHVVIGHVYKNENVATIVVVGFSPFFLPLVQVVVVVACQPTVI